MEERVVSESGSGVGEAGACGTDGGRGEESPREATLRALVLGVILAVVFGAANAYLGLKAGMTVSASIPAAVVSMGVLRKLFKDVSILENNMTQTIGSAGESLAAGVIFTVPALILMGFSPDWFTIFLMAVAGGFLGVLFMIPLRRYLIVDEHERLPYPEGAACAEVLKAGECGGEGASIVFKGLGMGMLVKLLYDRHGFYIFKETVEARLSFMNKALVGADLLPSLLGVGYIIGPRIASYMAAGGVLGWLVFIPLIHMLGSAAGGVESAVIFPASIPVSSMDAWAIWNNYIRYIGAGAVAFGGVMSLLRSVPVIVESFLRGFSGLLREFDGSKGEVGDDEELPRTERDIPMKYVLGGALLMALFIWWTPAFGLGLTGTLMVMAFTFFFVTVSSRIVGLVGSSSNPASGMTIATLLATSLILYLSGMRGESGMIAAVTVGAIVCIAICIAGDTSQDLKTGWLVGATPWRQQLGEFLGVLASAFFIGGTVYMLHKSYGIGSSALPAPQANLMKMVVEGVMKQNLPWGFVLVGALSALVVEMLGIESLPFAIGLYLPLSLSTTVLAGGLIRGAFEWRFPEGEGKASAREAGVLLSSGLIAGDALTGVVLAPLVYYEAAPVALLGLSPGDAGRFFRSSDPWSALLFVALVGGGLWYELWRRGRSGRTA